MASKLHCSSPSSLLKYSGELEKELEGDMKRYGRSALAHGKRCPTGPSVAVDRRAWFKHDTERMDVLN